MSEADPIEPHVQVIVKVAELAEMVNALPDECLVAGLDLLGDKTVALATLTNARDALAVLLGVISRAHERVLAASAKTDGAKLN